MIDATPQSSPQTAIVVPTFNEASNVEPLVEAISDAMGSVSWELIFVDDNSPDGTAQRVRELAKRDSRVRLVHRVGRRGLSTACIEGIMASTADYCVVMDADFQHDEAIIPQLLDALKTGHVDLAIGSRYASGGGFGEWSQSRLTISRLATWMAQKLTGTKISDPMSGFFAVRRDVFLRSLPGMSSIGFKVLLDIAASAPTTLTIAEVPYVFRLRTRGESKLDSLVLWEYFQLLIDKTIGRWIPTRFVSFAIIGAFGVIVHFLVLTFLFGVIDIGFMTSQAIATAVTISNNFFLNNQLTYSDRRLRGFSLLKGWISFNLVCAVGGFANVGVADWLFERPIGWIWSAFAGIAVSVVWNYAMSNIFTWRKR